ncbi:outer membrane beta-barrel family protein [Maribacter ulvicola]|uniref:Outer membrane receptor proteins, mostly Fe transport n=1 Tax=Maribacter ulvicola TaxID=228959 RepID=A0A1N6QTP5_9FLAO|nr:outer membrane beta-barrel family protein [Maribacter ulvicola]SIQ19990.1 Outer membrane receptor proteins, mostly Fe transport [Maribacter ulvicola]
MKAKIKILLTLLTIVCQTTFAQEIKVSGKVLDKLNSEPLEYATIIFIAVEDASKISGGITNEKGGFNITIAKGSYDIKVEYIGYTPYEIKNKTLTENTSLGTISLSEDAQALSEVVITSEKKLVSTKFDKKIYNVSKDLTTQGSNALEALNNVPSVNVSTNGGITLRGSGNIRILVNGKPSGLVGISNTQALERLQANSIESIEVITNPSARYDAEGASGIINIILKKGRVQGFNGSVQAVVGNPTNYGISANINYRKEKFNVFANGSYAYVKTPGDGFANTVYKDENNITTGFLNERSTQKRGGHNFMFAFGSDFYFNDNNTLTFMGLVTKEDNDNVGDIIFDTYGSDSNLLHTRLRTDNENEQDASNEFSLTYESFFDEEKEHVLTVAAKYDSNKEDEHSFYNDTFIFGTGADAKDRATTLETQSNLLFQADYIFPFTENGMIEAGYKSNFRDVSYNFTVEEFDSNANIWNTNTDLSNQLDYIENIHAIYGQYANKFGKFNILVGARIEVSDIDINYFTTNTFLKKNYTNIFPTLHLGYELSENDELKASYSKRIKRPGFWELNPFSSFTNDLNLESGNPDLNPMFTNSYELGYLKNWEQVNLNATTYFQHSTGLMQTVTTQTGRFTEDDIPILISKPLNIGTENRYGLEISTTYKPNSWLQINADANVFGYQQKGNFLNKVEDPNNQGSFIDVPETIDFSSSSWFARVAPKFQLPKDFDIQLRMIYNGDFKESTSYRKSVFVTNIAVNKELFDGKGSLNLSVSDLFNSRISRIENYNTSFSSYGKYQNAKRQVNLTFTYRFRNFKEKSIDEEEDDDDE